MLSSSHCGPLIYCYSNTEFELIQTSALSLLQAVPKRDDDDKTPAPPLFQENVFIEGSRTKDLENLHSEAKEGLKMMQQEGTKPSSDAVRQRSAYCVCVTDINTAQNFKLFVEYYSHYRNQQ